MEKVMGTTKITFGEQHPKSKVEGTWGARVVTGSIFDLIHEKRGADWIKHDLQADDSEAEVGDVEKLIRHGQDTSFTFRINLEREGEGGYMEFKVSVEQTA